MQEGFRREGESQIFGLYEICCFIDIWLAPAEREASKEGLKRWEEGNALYMLYVMYAPLLWEIERIG